MIEQKHNVPSLRFPGFTGGWDNQLFGEIYTFRSTNSYSRDHLNYDIGHTRNIHYGDIHVKFKSIFNIQNESVPFINKDIDLTKISNENYCKEKDLIIADASEDYSDIGKTIEIENLNKNKVLAGLHTILARPDKKEIASCFGGYLMQTEKVKSQIKKIAQGTKVLGLSSKRLAEISFQLPTLHTEQSKIADFLTSIDERIDVLKQKKIMLETYKKGIMQKLFSQEIRFKDDEGNEFGEWEERVFNNILIEHKLTYTGVEEVHSVSVHKGVINQVEHLGRVFAANDVSKYNLVKPGDIIYTKSPTGNFPLGIIKQSKLKENVIVSPLYGIFTPESYSLGVILDAYFDSCINTHNYLSSIIQKGAKNTINITNKTFLSKALFLPISIAEQQKIANFLTSLDEKIIALSDQITHSEKYKKGLLQQMFV